VVVVLGANAQEIRRRTEEEFVRLVRGGTFQRELRRAHRQRAEELEVEFVVNRSWKQGMYGSARLGLAAALERRPAAMMVLPVDHPGVKPETIRTLSQELQRSLSAWRSVKERSRFAYALVPRFRGQRGHPVALTPALGYAVAGDRQAEHLSDAIRRHAQLVGYLDVPDPGVVRNRNSPRD
jgi:CTP:molybdopterin cytidylyltransferase MocA